jgi:hypothetical protein
MKSKSDSLYLQLSNRLARLQARQMVLFLAALLSLPNIFCPKPALGLDPSWCHSLQVAATGGQRVWPGFYL